MKYYRDIMKTWGSVGAVYAVTDNHSSYTLIRASNGRKVNFKSGPNNVKSLDKWECFLDKACYEEIVDEGELFLLLL